MIKWSAMIRDPTVHTAYCQSVPLRDGGVTHDKREERESRDV